MPTDLISADEAGTLYGLLRERVRRAPEAEAYTEFDPAARRWASVTWREAFARAGSVAAALARHGLAPGDRVAILAKNGVDWAAFDMAAHRLGLVVVPLYVQGGDAHAAYMIDDSGAQVLLIDSAARWRRIGAHLERGTLRAVWVREGEAGDDGAPHPAPAPFAEVLAAATGDAPETPRAPSDVATLIYTSGTTGRPKGVMLSHEAILRNAENVAKVIPPRPEDVFLSVLPLAHAFERTLGYYAPMMGGSRVAFSRSLLRLREDFQEIAPTVLIGVPRLYQKLLSAAFDAAGGFKGRLLRMTAAIGWKRRSGARRSLAEIVAWPLLDRLVTQRFAQAFGGRLRIAVCGGAALPVDVARSLLGLGTPLVEGFGLTEAAPVVTASSLEAYEPGSVGFALPGIALKLSESGELLVRSPSSMLGYWGNEAATAGAFAGDGWLKTGDLAELRDGRVIVVGRARDTLVLLNGENVNPAPIEARLEADPLVDAICVVGHARPFLAALVSLNREAWTAWAAAAGLDPAAPNAPAAQKALLARFREALADLAPYERVRALHADLTPWSVERDLVTPTLKVRRANILRAFAEEIDGFYG